MNQQSQHTPTTLGAIFRFLLGFAGIVAAVSTLLSACGFLILRANASLLGLSFSLFHYSVHDYLYQGMRFIFWCLLATGDKGADLILGGLMFLLGNPYGWILVGLVLLCLLLYLLRSQFKPLSNQLLLWYNRLSSQIPAKRVKEFQKHGLFWAGYIVVIFLLLSCVLKMPLVPEARNLLFADGNSDEIRRRASEERLGDQDTQYGDLLLLVVVSGLILSGVHRKRAQVTNEKSAPRRGYEAFPSRHTRQQRNTPPNTGRLFWIKRLLLYLPDLIFICVLLMLPMIYGRSVYRNHFHQVKLVLDNELQTKLQADFDKSESIWLLRETSNSLILYFNGEAKSVHVIQKAKVSDFTLTKQQNLFTSVK